MTNIRSTTLFFREGSADKEYQIHLEQADGGYVVNIAYGRRGMGMKVDSKTREPVSLEAAEKIYDKLLREKTNKGYTEAESGMRYVGTGLEMLDSGISAQLPTAIQPEDVPAYENNDDWCAQEKFDGQNRMITVENDAVAGVNRRGLICPVPAHWAASDLPHANGRTVLCGEDMGATLVAFDVVEIDGECIRHLTTLERYAKLVELGKAAGDTGWLIIAEIAVGTAEKHAMLQRIIRDEGEGIVYKRSSAAFDSGRSKNSIKHKIQESSTFEVVKLNNQRSILVGVYDDADVLVTMGNVTVPANEEMPALGDLVEVQYMYRFENGALMQPKYKGLRTDIERPVRLSQIQRIKAKSLAA